MKCVPRNPSLVYKPWSDLLAMAAQPAITRYFKSRKRPVSLLKKDQELCEQPSKVFVTEKKLGLQDDKSLSSKVLYKEPSPSPDDEVGQISSIDTPAEEKPCSTPFIDKPSSAEDAARPSTPENFISVAPPATPTSIRNAQPSTPNHKNVVLPERPSTPEPNDDNLQAIQKVN